MGFFAKLFKRDSAEVSGVSTGVQATEKIDADLTLCAPITGTLLPLEEVPDIVISEKVMGEGVAVVPESETLVAPCDGVITRLLPTKNAFAIKAESGVEIYVTLGIEAMELAGEGFSLKAALGDSVKKGDPIISADLRLISGKLKSTIVSMIVIRNSMDIAKVSAATGACQAGVSPVLWIALQ